MKILAVEDDPSAAMVIESVLRYLGHEVILATTADDAFARVKAEPIRIVVSDWLLGRADGLDLCRRIRQSSRDYVYFILLTQREASDENEQLAMVAGVDDFLTKPVVPRELRMRLHVAQRILGYTQQVQQLESFLPVCSYCNKVRDDRDFWQQIEEYIRKRTGTRFSHGVCPDCYQKIVVPQLDQIDDVSGRKP
ncbi:MAG: response regulator transcription factor [Opitutaceae bacterium]|jgi:DNA-binding response OmpR family regulator|nr:response regulator transcription factor [Opitutaceae bacterium]